MNLPRARKLAAIAGLVLGGFVSSTDAIAQRQTITIEGHSYAGQTFGGSFHGHGLATLADGTQLKGRWDDNHFTRGTVRRSNGLEYRFEGRLKYIFRELDQLEVIGAGSARFEDGRVYNGAFGGYGLFHGEGSLTLADGSRQTGLWKDGVFVKAKPEVWEETSLEAEGLDRDHFNALQEQILDGAFGTLDSLLVVKDGKILIEEYFNGTSRYSPHDVQSVGKSFTSALMGIAIDKGFIPGVETKLMSYFPDFERGENWDSQKDEITIEDVLTMSYGLANDTSTRFYAKFRNYGQDWISEVLNLRLLSRPGSFFVYSSAASRFCAPVIEKASGMPVEVFAQKHLFGPLEIDMYRYLFLPDGYASLAGLEGLITRDLAKFGQMYLNKGVWRGRRILSEDWVERSTASHLKVARPDIGLTYGYHFWVRENWPVGNHNLSTFAASGLGGNKIYIFPKEKLVVVITSGAFDERYKHDKVRSMMERGLLPILLGDAPSL